MAYLKPQSPLKMGDNHIYPLTTYDQIMLEDGSRWDGGLTIDKTDADTGTIPYTNTDCLGGLTASEYQLKTEPALNSEKLGGKAPEYYIQPRNLLDNSDFTNPVNQRGQTTAENAHIVDRWMTFNDNGGGTVTLTPSGITTSGNAYLQQRLPSGTISQNKPFTLAVYYSDGTVDAGSNGYAMASDEFDIINHVYGKGKTIAHVALYEGEYTAETLPPYVPKGYAAELAECQRYYFEKHGGIHFISRTRNQHQTYSYSAFDICPPIMFPTTMRIKPEVTIYYDITDGESRASAPFDCSNTSCTMPDIVIQPNGWFDLNKVVASADL